MLTSYFRICKLRVLPLKTDIDKMFASPQKLWNHNFAQDVSGNLQCN